MYLRTILNNAAALCALAISVQSLAAQQHPAKRLSSIVGVAVEEYAKGVDARGRLISAQEYRETLGFLGDARDVAGRLSGERAAHARAVLDTLEAAVRGKAPPGRVDSIHARFVAALGADGALEMPPLPVSPARGRVVYQAHCAACHGATGMGDGPAARTIHPPPAAIGDATAMASATPALVYRVVSVGVAGTMMPAWAATLTPQQRWDVVAYIQSLHSTRAGVAEGAGLFVQRCAGCHGATGALDGPYTGALTRLPPDLSSLAWQATRSDSALAAAITHGVSGSAMPASSLSAAQTARVVAYIRTLPSRKGTAAVAARTGVDSVGLAARTVVAALDDALAAARAGKRSDAGDRAFDAYLAFEPLETPARARNPGLVSAMERQFGDFRGAVRENDLRRAQQARDVIEANLPDVVALTRRTAGGWAAFLESLLIIVREGFEAILVIGAVAAFLIKTGNHDRLRSIWVGCGVGVLASLLTAVVLQTALRAMPASRDLLEGLTMLVAVIVLFSVSYWLISRVEAAKWQAFIREKVASALEHGGGRALAFVAFLAVYREGAETALFYQALFGEGRHLAVPLLGGMAVGAVALALIFTLFYRYGVRLPLRPFFAVTSALLYYMAFVFAGNGIRELQEVNVVPLTVLHGFPHVEAMGIYPSLETVSAQLVLVLLFVVALVKTFWPQRAVALPTVPPGAPAAAAVDAHVASVEERVARLAERVAVLEETVVERDPLAGARPDLAAEDR